MALIIMVGPLKGSVSLGQQIRGSCGAGRKTRAEGEHRADHGQTDEGAEKGNVHIVIDFRCHSRRSTSENGYTNPAGSSSARRPFHRTRSAIGTLCFGHSEKG